MVRFPLWSPARPVVHSRMLGLLPPVAFSLLRGCSNVTAATPLISRALTSDATQGVLIVPLPKLSHTMTAGKLLKWHKQPGDRINMYDVLFEVATEELTEEVFKVDDFAGEVTLLVESQEEGWLAAIWQAASATEAVQVGTPVAVVCEDQQAVQKVAQEYKCPTRDVYDPAQPQVPILTWQSFLKSGTRKVKCMG